MKKVTTKEEEKRESKRQRLAPLTSDVETVCSPVKNKFPNPPWSLKDGETTNTFLRKPLKYKPSGVCLKFSIRGDCHSKCSAGKSYRKDLHQGEIKQINKFVADVRKMHERSHVPITDSKRTE